MHLHGTTIHPRHSALIRIAIALAIFAVASATFAQTNYTGYTLTVVGGSGQIVAESEVLPQRFAVQLADAQGHPVAGIPVRFWADTCIDMPLLPPTCPKRPFYGHFLDGALSALATTDSSGIATAPVYVAGTPAGLVIMAADVPDSFGTGGWLFTRISFAQTAATPVAPVNGLWALSQEITGAPGRGMVLEYQNNVLVSTVFGYRNNGSNAFYQAVGGITDNTFSAPLTEYRDGTAFGGSFRDGVSAGSPGQVRLVFFDETHGAVAFPGESLKHLRKFNW